jgi:phenylacetic acid degradation operon negative regulatory protein
MTEQRMNPALARVLQALRPPPAWSLIVTVYGDAVVPRGGSLWLGTLLQIMAAFGVGGGVVRTAMSRLASDGWLERTRIGRNSFYRLTAKGRVTFEAATERIYFAPPHAWDGRLRLAVLDEGDDRAGRRAALEGLGFGQLAPGVLVGLDDPRPTGGATVLTAVDVPDEDGRRLAARAWPLDRIADGYRRFLSAFGAAPRNGERLSDLESLLLRVVLIHEYRRIILLDPLLPKTLLPQDWPGHEARELCAALYRSLLAPSERWLGAHGRNEDGPLPTPDERFHRRFM